jgi:hypothetical protein
MHRRPPHRHRNHANPRRRRRPHHPPARYPRFCARRCLLAPLHRRPNHVRPTAPRVRSD